MTPSVDELSRLMTQSSGTMEYNAISSYYTTVASSNAIINFRLGLSRVLGVFMNFIPSTYLNNYSYDGFQTTPLINDLASGDIAEVKAVKEVFGEHAYGININSTKSMTGHLLGAAGAIEAIACIMSIKEGIVPPTINHETNDENIDSKLNFTFGKSQKRDVNIAMSNTFGFGGHNACVLFKKLNL